MSKVILNRVKCIIGKNNYIEPGVKISKNVQIGNNNKIYDGTVIYPNTVIGNNNVILNDNILGEHPVHADEPFFEKKFGGLLIGNNNFIHVKNIIFSGLGGKTTIKNDNKILGETHIGHDACIHNNVHIYPRAVLGGYSQMLSNSGMGLCAIIHQNKVIGDYSFIGMNNTISKSIFPFFININHKYSRINSHKIKLSPGLMDNINACAPLLDEICAKYQNKTLNISEYKNALPKNVYAIIANYLSHEVT